MALTLFQSVATRKAFFIAQFLEKEKYPQRINDNVMKGVSKIGTKQEIASFAKKSL